MSNVLHTFAGAVLLFFRNSLSVQMAATEAAPAIEILSTYLTTCGLLLCFDLPHLSIISANEFFFLFGFCVVRDQEGFSIWTGPPFDNGQLNAKIGKVPCTSAVFSEDGSMLMVIKPDCIISIFDSKSYKEIKSIQVSNLVAASLSPRGTYLLTFQKPSSPQEKNVNLWKVETGTSVYNLSQKNMTKATW